MQREKSKKTIPKVVQVQVEIEPKPLSTIDSNAIDSNANSEIQNFQEESEIKLRNTVLSKTDEKTIVKINNNRRGKEERKMNVNGTLTNSYISSEIVNPDESVYIPKMLRQKPVVKKLNQPVSLENV